MDLRELYQEVILDHYKKPRNSAALDDANRHADGHNPLCGDRIHVSLRVVDDRVEDISFQGAGCAISTASASMMTEAIKGKPLVEIEKIFQSFHGMVTGKDTSDQDGSGEKIDLGKLEALQGVREIPIRVKCATLAWHTLQAALKDQNAPISTE